MYEIRYDPDQALIQLKIEGFWSAETAQAFATELAVAVSKARSRGQFCVFSDARKFAVQSPEVVERFSAMAEKGAAARTAIVVTSALARSQAKRAMENGRVRTFADMDEARQWVTEPVMSLSSS